jgi:hypothetical protein
MTTVCWAESAGVAIWDQDRSLKSLSLMSFEYLLGSQVGTIRVKSKAGILFQIGDCVYLTPGSVPLKIKPKKSTAEVGVKYEFRFYSRSRIFEERY